MTSTAGGRVVCEAVTAAGERCRAYACTGGRFCFVHDPGREAERAAARSRGGHARHGRALAVRPAALSLATLPDVARVLERAVSDLFLLENSVSRARAAAYLVAVALRTLELTDLERRVSALEEQLLQGGGIYEQ